MTRRLWAGFGLLILIAIGAYLVWPESAAVDLPGGNKLGILNVSAGSHHFYNEEKGWRRLALEVVPETYHSSLNISKRQSFTTRGSLAIWVTEIDGESRKRVVATFRKPEVLFGDGRAAPGKITSWGTNVVQIEFPIYPRGDARIQIRLRYVGQEILFAVDNPAPVKAAHWDGAALPQTNVCGKMLVVLNRQADGRLSLRGIVGDGPPRGWTVWQIEAEDSVGNWAQFAGPIWELTNRVFQPGPLKVRVRPVEYISAGFVTNGTPASNLIHELNVNDRARELGLGKLFFLGPGEYLFTNTIPMVHTGPPMGAGVEAMTTNSAGKWDVHIASRGPSLVAIYELPAHVEIFDARLRERLPGGKMGGQIFEPWRPALDMKCAPPQSLLRQFSVTRVNSTAAIEAEVVARHRPVEFVFAP